MLYVVVDGEEIGVPQEIEAAGGAAIEKYVRGASGAKAHKAAPATDSVKGEE